MLKTNTNLIIRSLLLTVCVTASSMFSANAQQSSPYPKVTGYVAILNPIGSWSKQGFADNFSKVYTIGFPFGINILKSEHFGVSFELVPSIRTENGISKVNSVLFHPGAMFRFSHGFTFIARAAFETNGRFGFTPVVNQVLLKGKNVNLYAAIPVPLRFGNGQPASLGAGLQVGVGF
ncbi:hypothetical protein HDC90_001465 [Pedobacter sp. AK013]|uniref:hypothetical protein n=1 Tax=Pedobacter sp. AK013 TaxID=2723071 RepID=UPI0016109D43|nr:hypothetical protein [Pedobacter sp. AK013]MBB6236850.1 hypothetical protein [Pedobacter sp. AK013]